MRTIRRPKRPASTLPLRSQRLTLRDSRGWTKVQSDEVERKGAFSLLEDPELVAMNEPLTFYPHNVAGFGTLHESGG